MDSNARNWQNNWTRLANIALALAVEPELSDPAIRRLSSLLHNGSLREDLTTDPVLFSLGLVFFDGHDTVIEQFMKCAVLWLQWRHARFKIDFGTGFGCITREATGLRDLYLKLSSTDMSVRTSVYANNDIWEEII